MYDSKTIGSGLKIGDEDIDWPVKVKEKMHALSSTQLSRQKELGKFLKFENVLLCIIKAVDITQLQSRES
jgi:hypothetical protein